MTYLHEQLIGASVYELADWSDHGLVGMIIGALFVSLWIFIKALIQIIQQQRDERGQWLSAYKEVSNQFDKRQIETNLAIRELTAVTSELVAMVRGNQGGGYSQGHRDPRRSSMV